MYHWTFDFLSHPHKMFRFPSPSLSWRWVGRSGKKKKKWTNEGVWVSVKAGLPSLFSLHRTRWQHPPERWRRRLVFNSVLKLRVLKLRFFNPLTPVPPVTGRDEPRPFSHFWRHPFWPKLASSILSCAGGKHLSNDAQIRVTGRMAPEICTKMLKKLSGFLGSFDAPWSERS